jgi:hypothetical protein
VRFASYILRHWRGDVSLAQAFWVNLVLLTALLELLRRFVLPPYIENEVIVTSAVAIYLVVTKLIIYPWQVMGVIRVSDRHIKTDIGRSWANFAQIALVASLAFTLLTTIETYQSLQIFKQDLILKNTPAEKPQYSLDLIEGDTLIHLRGPFQIGITNVVEDLIARHPSVIGIILDSNGGQIYEGRGLARIIRENRLRTISLQMCLSSCTTAFVAGIRRTLGENARLGFHQYKTYSIIPSVDIDNEQAKDMAIFINQGVSPQFLEKIFSQPPEKMWWPEIDELVSAGVVQQVGFSLSTSEE